MKKLLAILLSALMLCAMIPFATVAAADEPTIELIASEEEVNAGDEFEVEVNLLNLEDTAGLISALVEIGFDPDVFELVTYFDEDEEAWFPPIEIGSKYNASSNKYIMFSPIDEETGAMERCLVKYMRATATTSQVRREEHFFTVTFKVKDDAVSGTYDLTVIQDDGLFHGNIKFDFASINTSITVNGSEPEVPSCEHEYEYDCSKNCSKCGEETRPEAEHEYFYACDGTCMYCYEYTNENAAHNEVHVDAVEATCQVNGNIEYWYCDICGASWDANGMPVNRFTVITFGEHVYANPCDAHCAVCGELTNEEAAHTIVAVDAKAPTCTEAGNVAYWYCSDCGAAWLDAECTMVTNMMAVKLGATCSTNAIHSEGVEPGCHYTGWTENWYCANCDVYYLDAACTIITNYKSLTIPALQNTAEYVPAKDATCYENGNVEYWVCYECEQVWADEALTQLTNIKNVQIAPAHNVIYVEAVAAGCENEGNIEYWYCDVCGSAWLDAECTLVTNLMSVKLGISHNVEYVAAKDATCDEPGNIEYWYCVDCGAAWLDEYCHLNTNLMAVILPISHNVIHVEAKDATCSELGNIEYWYCADCGQAWLDELCHYNTNLMAVKLPTIDHVYSNAHDASCDVCGTERDIVLGASDIIIEGGNSITEIKGGLAFKFDAAISGITYNEEYIADYSNATVTIDGVEYKLITMGAIVNNKGYAEQTLANVDNTYVLDVVAEKVFTDAKGATSYAIRIINIPSDKLDTIITARSYFVYENAEGEQITVYGADWATSYNAELNG